MESLTATGALQEVRKMEKFLSDLHRLGEVLEVVAADEKIRNKLQAESAALSEQVVQQQDKLFGVTDQVKQKEEALTALISEHKKTMEEIKQLEEERTKEANKRLRDLKNEWLVTKEQNRMELMQLHTEKDNLKKDISNLKEQLQNIRVAADKEAKRVLDAFKHLNP